MIEVGLVAGIAGVIVGLWLGECERKWLRRRVRELNRECENWRGQFIGIVGQTMGDRYEWTL